MRLAQPTTYLQLEKAAGTAERTHAPEQLSVRASLLVWIVLSAAGWGVLYSLYRMILG